MARCGALGCSTCMRIRFLFLYLHFLFLPVAAMYGFITGDAPPDFFHHAIFCCPLSLIYPLENPAWRSPRDPAHMGRSRQPLSMDYAIDGGGCSLSFNRIQVSLERTPVRVESVPGKKLHLCSNDGCPAQCVCCPLRHSKFTDVPS